MALQDPPPTTPILNRLGKAVLIHMLKRSLFEDSLRGSQMDHEDLSNVLRMRVLDGQDLSAEEMLYEVNRIRQGRRSAAASAKSTGKTKATRAPTPPENLLDILDQDI